VNPRVRFDEEADVEYRSAGLWYENRREHLGVEFLDAVDATIEQVVAMPRAGTSVRRLSADLTVRRRAVTRFPYHVVYMELATHIRILAIAHDRRKPGYWKDRAK
jgi:plasmid stabilization system protein ParE